MSNDRGHAANISDWMLIGLFAKLLQLGEQLRQHVLIDVVSLVSLRGPIKTEMQFVANDAFDDGLGMLGYELGEELFGVFIAGPQQKRLEQGVDFDNFFAAHSATLASNAPN